MLHFLKYAIHSRASLFAAVVSSVTQFGGGRIPLSAVLAVHRQRSLEPRKIGEEESQEMR